MGEEGGLENRKVDASLREGSNPSVSATFPVSSFFSFQKAQAGERVPALRRGVVQLVERLFWEQEAAGSRPVTSTTNLKERTCLRCLTNKNTSSRIRRLLRRLPLKKQ